MKNFENMFISIISIILLLSYVGGCFMLIKCISDVISDSDSSTDTVETVISFTTPYGSKTTVSGTTFEQYIAKQDMDDYIFDTDGNGYVFERKRMGATESIYLSYNGSRVKATDTIISGATYIPYTNTLSFTTPLASRSRTASLGDTFATYIGDGSNTEAGGSILRSDSDGYVFEVYYSSWISLSNGSSNSIEVSYIGLNGEKVKATDRIISGENYSYVDTKTITG